jgi:hypothetical protein
MPSFHLSCMRRYRLLYVLSRFLFFDGEILGHIQGLLLVAPIGQETIADGLNVERNGFHLLLAAQGVHAVVDWFGRSLVLERIETLFLPKNL